MPTPNFFVVGVPKAGTTALCSYLRDHPSIFITDPKEPNFFNKDFTDAYRRRRSFATAINTEEEYVRLYGSASDTHQARGEGTVWYLYSNVALKNIKQFTPNAKIIAIFRDPVEMVYSLHSQLQFSLNEDVADFQEAWELQEARSRGEAIPPRCQEPMLLHYRAVARYEEQLSRLYHIFDCEQVLPLLFDDFADDTLTVYRRVLDFLKIDYDGRCSFPRINQNKQLRSRILQSLLVRPPRPLQEVVQKLKDIFSLNSLGFGQVLNRLNKTRSRRSPLSPDFEAHLRDCFKQDIEAVEDVTGVHLESWMC